MKKLHLLLMVFSISLNCFAQNTSRSCSSPEASQFDFWIGEWELTWNDSLHGKNSIQKILGNCTIEENFSDPARSYFGRSWSVYNSNYRIWQQTWVDNAGGYIHLTGKMSGDSMILKTEERTVPAQISPTGKIINRMVFYNIKPVSFDWSWESSTDGGKTWTPRWQIHYKRKS